MSISTTFEDSEIGGFFELELPPQRAFYREMLALNSGRNCLVHLLRVKRIRSIHLPYFNCEVVHEAVRYFCPEVTINFYHVSTDFQPILDRGGNVECLFYVNYYALNDAVVPSSPQYLVIDNAQALYSPPLAGGYSIYSPRKFVGVPDGGYLSGDDSDDPSLPSDISWPQSKHLLHRIDTTASSAYPDFQEACRSMRMRPLRRMSRLTTRILGSVDHGRVAETRRKNFSLLHGYLGPRNDLSSLIEKASARPSFVPLCYPLLTRDASHMRTALVRHKIYAPVYWPELRGSSALSPDEQTLVDDVLCLPIDQRYGEPEMLKVAGLVRELT
jgi:hypothetical protein